MSSDSVRYDSPLDCPIPTAAVTNQAVVQARPNLLAWKLHMVFDGPTADIYFTGACSAWPCGTNLVCTAAHCVYNHSKASPYPSLAFVIPAASDAVNSDFDGSEGGQIDAPYGIAVGLDYTVTEGWIDYGNATDPDLKEQGLDVDFAIISIDRPLGNTIPWSVQATTVSEGDAVYYTGYPTETPYVPDNVVAQFAASASIVGMYSEKRFLANTFGVGGHSGGPTLRLVRSPSLPDLPCSLALEPALATSMLLLISPLHSSHSSRL